MNTKQISRFFGLFSLLLLLLVTTTTSAQTKGDFPSLVALDQSQINSKVVKSFEQKFKNATALNWYQAKENNVLVKYSQDDQMQYALFNAKGTPICQFTYGTERDLPLEIKTLYGNKYWKATIINVANVKQDSRDIWIICAKEGNNSFAVKIEDREVEAL